MYFTVLPSSDRPPSQAFNCAFLWVDNWNDWGEFRTQYHLVVFDELGARHNIGDVKIGQFGWSAGQERPAIPNSFSELNFMFFSLGQDDSYYLDLGKLGAQTRERILVALRDVAYDSVLFQQAAMETVTRRSLLRSVSKETVIGQFHRISHGGSRLTRYEFTYRSTTAAPDTGECLEIGFSVDPESFPPTNVHVLIGRNGVGKTTLLDSLARSVSEVEPRHGEIVHASVDLDAVAGSPPGPWPFAGMVLVTFSAFDPFEPIVIHPSEHGGFESFYVGLKIKEKDSDSYRLKELRQLAEEFADSVEVCRKGARVKRWRAALELLQADPIFCETDVLRLASTVIQPAKVRSHALSLFKNLSSGHKVVLLAVTRLVETVAERTLVLVDEPEAHLHPPLLSAFIRALSDLLADRNGVAIIATHSPVVLQEVPKRCVWKLRRSGEIANANRPEIETFGENVGVLTREVFQLEVTNSGFHKLLADAVNAGGDFQSIAARFRNELGGEARAILRVLLSSSPGSKQN